MADLTKSLLYGCVFLSALGGASHAWLGSQIDAAEKDRKRALQMLKQVSQAAEDVQTLETERDEDEWLRKAANSRHHEYFAECATKAGLSKGPGASAPKDTTPNRGKDEGFKDTTFDLSWNFARNETPGFERRAITHLLWELEDGSKLLKVTQLKLQTDDSQWNDLWVPRIEVTERKPVQKGSS